jgi:peptide chain release factor 2
VAIEPEELQSELERMRDRTAQAHDYLNFDTIRGRIEAMEAEAADADFWSDASAAQDHMRTLKRFKGTIEPWEALGHEVAEALELAELAAEDPSMVAELIDSAQGLSKRLDSLETRALMNDPDDTQPCYFYIHAGAGGTESCDWAAMLLRMYSRWCEQTGMAAEMIELTDGEEAGIRSVTLLITGDFAYGQLKAESGVHRLVRISPFDANKRRHTSFCSVHAWPQVDDTIEVEIKDEDLKIDTYRASGAGGQHVNKTDSAVRLTHLPTKIVVQCQNERSQHQNKAQAMTLLRSRLHQLYTEQQEAEKAAKQNEKKDISWGNQIRSYVFQPYQMVKDHRTSHETGNIPAVMDGAIDGFIEAYLRWSAGMNGAGSGAKTT